jgi:hypothetical protein
LLNGEEAEPRTELERQMLAKKVKSGDDFPTWVVHNMTPAPPREQPLPVRDEEVERDEEASIEDAVGRIDRWLRETQGGVEGAGTERGGEEGDVAGGEGG